MNGRPKGHNTKFFSQNKCKNMFTLNPGDQFFKKLTTVPAQLQPFRHKLKFLTKKN
jgi:hypothetical protein